MKVLKLPKAVYAYTHIFLGCPHCGRFSRDRRYKSEISSSACHVYRMSSTSVTMRCRNCHLRFTVTWNAMVGMMERLKESDSDRDHSKIYDNIISVIKLATTVTTNGRKLHLDSG